MKVLPLAPTFEKKSPDDEAPERGPIREVISMAEQATYDEQPMTKTELGSRWDS